MMRENPFFSAWGRMIVAIPVWIGCGALGLHLGGALSRTIEDVSGRDPADLTAMSIWCLFGGAAVCALAGVYGLFVVTRAPYETRYFTRLSLLLLTAAWGLLVIGTFPWFSPPPTKTTLVYQLRLPPEVEVPERPDPEILLHDGSGAGARSSFIGSVRRTDGGTRIAGSLVLPDGGNHTMVLNVDGKPRAEWRVVLPVDPGRKREFGEWQALGASLVSSPERTALAQAEIRYLLQLSR